MDNTGVGGTLGTSIGTQTGLLWEFPLLLYCTYEDYGAGLAVVLEEPPTAVHRPRPVPLHLRPGGENWLKITEFFPSGILPVTLPRHPCQHYEDCKEGEEEEVLCYLVQTESQKPERM